MLFETDRNVYVLAYFNRFGLHVTTYSTKAAVSQSVENIIVRNRNKFNVPDEVSTSMAIAKWKELTGGEEWIEIQEDRLKRLIKD